MVRGAERNKAPKAVEKAIAQGADLLFIWAGDGMVQRCIDALGDEKPALAIIPAGTANLLAKNLGIPADIVEAVRVGLHGDRRALDTGRVNGERFAVMAGVGIDALMIRDADSGLKDRVGRLGYIITGAKHLGDESTRARHGRRRSMVQRRRAACCSPTWGRSWAG